MIGAAAVEEGSHAGVSSLAALLALVIHGAATGGPHLRIAAAVLASVVAVAAGGALNPEALADVDVVFELIVDEIAKKMYDVRQALDGRALPGS